MSSYKRSGQPLRLNANEVTKAIRAGEMLDQLMGSRGGTSGRMPQALMARVKNSGSADIPAWGLCRWFGNPVQPATIGGTVPELVLRTVTDTTRPIGVAVNQIKAAASPNPAEIGQVQIMGVCWARCRGPIAANDGLVPDDDFFGISGSGSNVKALASVSGESEAIIPVLIGGGGADTTEYVRVYTLAIRGNASAGTIDWSVLLGEASDTGTWNFDDDDVDIKTSLTAFDAAVLTGGGDLRWNVIKIKFSDPDVTLRVTGQALTRETNGIEPKVELSSCYEPSAWWLE